MRQLKIFALYVGLALGGLSAAQSGGGFGGSGGGGSSGGGGFGGGGGYSGGGYRGGGGYYGGGGYIPVPVGGYGYGGGGGSGLITLLVIGAVVFFAVAYMRRSLGGAGRGLAGLTGAGSAQAVSVQLLLSEGDEVKRALREVASGGDPDAESGLARMLSEAALVALRYPERWAYGAVERASGDGNRMNAQVGFWATQARAAFTEQTTSNYQDTNPTSGYLHKSDYQAKEGGLYLAVTLAVAAWNLPPLPPEGAPNAQEARAALTAISGVNPADLIRAEVVWSPDAAGEFLSEDEAIQKYPRLTKF